MQRSVRVLNRHKDHIPPDAVYIGRGSPYGNPFKIGEHGTREEVVQKYAEFLDERPELKVLVVQALRGKDLVCFCAPNSCHGDILLRIANEE